MGLKNKAIQFRRTFVKDQLSNLEDHYSGKTLTRKELQDIRKAFEKKMESVKGALDRKIIDMQTLFEVGKELNSSFDSQLLIQIILFTLMGQFNVSDIAVFLKIKDDLCLSEKKGFASIENCPGGGFNSYLAERENFISTSLLANFQDFYALLTASGAAGLMPIKNKDKLIGFIILGKKAKGDYSEEDLNFIYTLSSLAGIALDNAGLYDEIKQANARLDKKLSELSTLYEISKVINTSNDLALILSLIMETITTGFGVRKAALFIKENGRAIIDQSIGLNNPQLHSEINLLPEEELLLNQNKTEVLNLKSRSEYFAESPAPYLFIPLVSANEKIGGIFLISIEKYVLSENDQELLDLFAIIASQAAPPIAMAKLIKEKLTRMQDPFHPLLERMKSEIKKASEFGVGVIFGMLKLKNFSQYIQLHGGKEASEHFESLTKELETRLTGNILFSRYASNRLLLIMPGMIESETDDIKDTILRAAMDAFQDNKQIDIGADFLLSSYPGSGDDVMVLLNLIE